VFNILASAGHGWRETVYILKRKQIGKKEKNGSYFWEGVKAKKFTLIIHFKELQKCFN